MSQCDITPISAFQSTNLSNKITSFNRLSERILRSLGYPFINVEVHRDQLYENISIACEMFTKFAGYTREYILFNSSLYERDIGIRLDTLVTLKGSSALDQARGKTSNSQFTNYVPQQTLVYIANSDIPGKYFAGSTTLSAALSAGVFVNEIFDETTYNNIISSTGDVLITGAGDLSANGVYTLSAGGTYIDRVYANSNGYIINQSFILSNTLAPLYENNSNNNLYPWSISDWTVDEGQEPAPTSSQISFSSKFTPSYKREITQLGSIVSSTKYNNSFDYDVMDYRKVIAITDFEQGSTTGINTLFTIEQTLAQQTYFSYAMGNYGFDLISWYVLKDWLNNREKLLAIKPSYDFNDRTQLMRIYPQPKAGESTSQYYGVISCYVEKPLRDVIQEQWVYQYSLALTKIVLARVRGKYQGTTLFGGGSVNADMLSEGLAEKEKLEQQLYEGATPGLGDNEPPLFFVG